MLHHLSPMNATLLLVCVFNFSLVVCNASTKLTFAFVSSQINNHDVCAFSKPSLSTRCRQRQLYSQTASQDQGQDQQQQQHSSGRRWRNKRKRQTFLPSPVRSVTSYDEDALMDQLGYMPSNACRVSARSGDTQTGGDIINVDNTPIDTSSNGIGRPIAIQSYPLLIQLSQNKQNSYTPFPTMYWLTCPHVSRAISELERIGHVRNFQLKLEGDKDLSNQWWDANEEYANERWHLLSDEDRDWLLGTEDVNDGDDAIGESEKKKRESMRKIIQFSGVAGTDHRGLREDDDASGNNAFVPSVKCMHSHYGHYRSQLSKSTEQNDATTIKYNLVGKWTHELLLEHFPEVIF